MFVCAFTVCVCYGAVMVCQPWMLILVALRQGQWAMVTSSIWYGTNRSFQGESTKEWARECMEREYYILIFRVKRALLWSLFLAWDIQQTQRGEKKEELNCHVWTHQLCPSLWVTHPGPKPRVGLLSTVSMSNEMLRWSVMLWAADPCESLFNSRFNFFSSSGFRSVIYQLNGHWNSATKWHFKDGLTAARLLDFQKSKNNGCTMTQQNKNLQKLGRYSTFFTISLLISDCSSRVLKGVLVPEADLSALYLFQFKYKQITGFRVTVGSFAFSQHHVSISLKKAQRSQSNQFCNTLLSSPIYPMVL